MILYNLSVCLVDWKNYEKSATSLLLMWRLETAIKLFHGVKGVFELFHWKKKELRFIAFDWQLLQWTVSPRASIKVLNYMLGVHIIMR